ncbi:unnamed protein product, partial [Lymnaea stagnalis]
TLSAPVPTQSSSSTKIFLGHKRRIQDMCQESNTENSYHPPSKLSCKSPLPSAKLADEALDLSSSMHSKDHFDTNDEQCEQMRPMSPSTPFSSFGHCTCDSCISGSHRPFTPYFTEDLPRCLTPLDPGPANDFGPDSFTSDSRSQFSQDEDDDDYNDDDNDDNEEKEDDDEISQPLSQASAVKFYLPQTSVDGKLPGTSLSSVDAKLPGTSLSSVTAPIISIVSDKISKPG